MLAVFDSSQPLSDDDKELIDLLTDAPALAVINKTDLPQQLETDYIRSRIKHLVFISALEGIGAYELEKQVSEIIGTSKLDASQGILATERQRAAADNALHSIDEAMQALTAGITLDAVTVIIEEAINNLLELTGERVTEAVVDTVFSHFCVGK